MAHAKPQRFCFVSDTHGDMIDRKAEKVFREFVKWWKPTIRVHGGDAFDFRSLRKGCSDEERAEGMTEDLEQGLAFLKWYKPQAFLLGNHDIRLWDTAERSMDGARRTLASHCIDAIIDRLPNVKLLPYHVDKGVYRIGDLRCVHGYHHNIHAPMKAAEFFTRVVMGHIHTVAHYASPAHEGPRECWSAGCLCKLDMGYNNRKPGMMRHAHGWVYGLVYPDGHTNVWQAQQVGDRWVFPSEYKEIRSAGQLKRTSGAA